MAINGITFDRMRVTTKSDALLYYSMLDNNDRIIKGYKNELNVSATGLSVFVSTGACVVQGRLIDVDEEELVSVSANDTGYICLVIDLTQVNTSEGEAGTPGYTPVNNQVRLEVVKELVQQDLFEEGKLYTFPLASFTSTGTTVNLTKIDHNQRIVESGSNSNGSWTKIADGTMICFRNFDKQPVSIPPNGEWNEGIVFPQKFIGNPITSVEGFPTNTNGDILYIPLVSILATGLFPGKWGIGFKNTSTHTITRVLNIELIAIGRWK